MQQDSGRRSNRQRTEATQAALIAAARRLFVEKGYAETGTPEIVRAAKVTRGALYHHFADKADLFRAVLEAEADAVARSIARDTEGIGDGLAALVTGAEAGFTAVAEAGRVRLLLRDGPAVLGPEDMRVIDRRTGGEELRQGLAQALGGRDDVPLEALSEMLSAAFDSAARAIAEGRPAGDYKAAARLLLEGLLARTG